MGRRRPASSSPSSALGWTLSPQGPCGILRKGQGDTGGGRERSGNGGGGGDRPRIPQIGSNEAGAYAQVSYFIS